jgi:hypothetical protein
MGQYFSPKILADSWAFQFNLSVFRVQRRIFGPERGDVAGGWRSPHHQMLLGGKMKDDVK